MAERKYTGQDITVLEGLEPVRKRPGMYIGGIDARGYHHLLWEIVDNSVDEVINGYAKTIERHAPQGRRRRHRRGQRPRHPRRHTPEVQEDRARADPVHAARRRQVRARQLHPLRRPARRRRSVVNALSDELTATIRRDGAEHVQTFARGKPTTQAQRDEAASARHRHDHLLPARPRDLRRQAAASTPPTIRERLEAKTYLHGGLHIIFKDEAHGREGRASPTTAASPSTCAKLVAERGKPPVHPTSFAMREGRSARRGRAAVDRVHRRARPLLRQRHPHRRRRHARGRLQGRRRQGDPQLHRDARARAQGREHHRRGHPRGPRRACCRVYVRDPQFQGQTKDQLNNPEVQRRGRRRRPRRRSRSGSTRTSRRPRPSSPASSWRRGRARRRARRAGR